MAGTTPILRRSLVAVVALLALAGCSSSGGEDTAPTTTAAEATTAAPDGTDTTEAPDDTEPTETTEAPDDTEPTEPAEGGEDVCEALQVLSDYDQQSSAIINEDDWPAIQAFFVDSTDDVLAAYDDAIAAGSEVTDELEELRSITEGTSELAAESSDLLDFGSKISELPGIMEAGVAGQTLNEFAESTCGFSTGGN